MPTSPCSNLLFSPGVRVVAWVIAAICSVAPATWVFLSFTAVVVSAASAPPNTDWPTYLGDKQRSLYSPLSQIHRANVAQLQVAWTYDTGEKGEYQANNLVVGGVLYTPTQSRRVIALDAATGRELWKWDPATTPAGTGGRRQRGLVYWQNDTGGEARLFTAVGKFLFRPEHRDVERHQPVGEGEDEIAVGGLRGANGHPATGTAFFGYLRST